MNVRSRQTKIAEPTGEARRRKVANPSGAHRYCDRCRDWVIPVVIKWEGAQDSLKCPYHEHQDVFATDGSGWEEADDLSEE